MKFRTIETIKNLAISIAVGILASALLFTAIWLLEGMHQNFYFESALFMRIQIVSVVAGLLTSIVTMLIIDHEAKQSNVYFKPCKNQAGWSTGFLKD